MERIISKSPGKQTHIRWDGDDTTIVTEQDVDLILSQNRRVANEWKAGDYQTGSDHTQKVAELPAVMYYELVSKFGTPDQNPSDWFKFFNDPENRGWRTTGGSL